MKFTVDGYFKGAFSKDYEKYINDQFIFRDDWINLKSRSEYILGKIENNGIVYGKEDYLFEKYNILDKNRVMVNIDSINKYIDSVNAPVSLMIVPNSYEVYKENLPKGAPLINQNIEIESIYEKINCENEIDLRKTMEDNKDNYIYYKTDHHWTTEGAFIAYSKFIESIGESKIHLGNYKKEEVLDFYGTYYSKAKPFNIESDLLSYYEFDNIEMKIDDKEYNTLYDYEKLNIRDKYSLFLYGNNPLTIIKNTELKNGKKLLIIKDSYANSMVPFLTQNYEEIHVVDLRTFMTKITEYTNNNYFDNVLILYNFVNFAREASIVKLKS
ncbi:DHHW family protein [Clostridium sp.]|uniref:DHHW family protein n=1 Tax=Clostridium sp. TaxID=1506 RepID=UPI003F3FADC9